MKRLLVVTTVLLLLAGCVRVPGKLTYIGLGNVNVTVGQGGEVTLARDTQPIYATVQTLAPVAAQTAYATGRPLP